MTIFSVNLNDNFKILDKKVYFNENDFLKLCKSTSLDIVKNELTNYKLENKLIKVNPNNFPLTTRRYSKEELCKYIESEYQLNGLNKEKPLYPEWLLFYIATQNFSFVYTSKAEFEKHISFFEIIAEIRHKNYIKSNRTRFINTFDNNDELLNSLENSFNLFIELLTKESNIEKLYNFLAFLWKFHDELKAKEKYKLMWNLEAYIVECIHLLKNKGIDIEYIYTHHKKLVYRERLERPSPLHEIQINLPLYIKENKCYFYYNPDNEPSILDKINNCLSDDVTIDKLLEVFTSNEKIQNLVFLRLEIDRFYNSNKFNEFVMKSLIKNFVLEIESLIIDKVPKNKDGLFDNIKQLKKGSHKFSAYHEKLKENVDWSEFSNRIKVIEKESDSIEKHLMIYYHFRNYFAHNHVNMHDLRSEDGKYLRAILESALITIYFVATFNTDKTFSTC
ncbi:hypothetical protein [Francisella adeliensis]|uniref:Uncharacterized protein n=1 Tax=Francisella adeliensis TaxID=2007306 RepID=A0A2Z4Y114_9GAMM|nr:hypothetical protein [Francisella adeliensis]AXA34245.1 hypothetical protein CDH04_07435 [Francisella adeliensis]MBK2084886.1 hypothetical protein [Francisella adeliensis]MBK2096283.1 hypothetical protein [Francisella adeliensis]QIW12489.1 hypothetical protein FZC43_07440 [Francisella adeliensis]QIW14362.1 hypothetical protein FZC44_07435 [Francisella adeliensis]